jgi:hypothetical protein
MAIEFSCPHCQQLVRTPLAAAGKKGRCPGCGAVVRIPALESGKTEQPLQRPTAPQKSAFSPPPSEPGAVGIEFYCVECGQLVRTPATAAGKKGKCPHCKALIDIPRKAVGSKSSGSFPRHTPRPPTAELPPLEELEPLDLAPPPPAHVPPRDMAPLLEEVLPELQPLPAGSLPSASGSAPQAARNPFASPAPVSWRKGVVDLGRRGLPWERDPSLESFFDTVRYVLAAPGDAFLTMTRQGIGSPLGFFMVSAVSANLVALVLLVLLQILLATVYFMFAGLEQPLVIRWDIVALRLGGAACVAIVVGLLIGLVGNLINSVFYHVCLLVCGAANAGFETTYRVVSFGLGSIMVLAAIPIVGPLLALVMQPIVLTYGFMNAHETSGWRAFVAAILPWLVVVAILAVVLLANLPTIIESMRAGLEFTHCLPRLETRFLVLDGEAGGFGWPASQRGR